MKNSLKFFAGSFLVFHGITALCALAFIGILSLYIGQEVPPLILTYARMFAVFFVFTNYIFSVQSKVFWQTALCYGDLRKNIYLSLQFYFGFLAPLMGTVFVVFFQKFTSCGLFISDEFKPNTANFFIFIALLMFATVQLGLFTSTVESGQKLTVILMSLFGFFVCIAVSILQLFDAALFDHQELAFYIYLVLDIIAILLFVGFGIANYFKFRKAVI